MVKILVFDTETSGLPPEISGRNWEERTKKNKQLLSYSDFKKKKSTWDSYINQWPSIIQLSYILYDTEDPQNSKIFNKYIDLPDTIEISKESMAIHHITKESISAVNEVNRAKIYDALDEFMSDVDIADVVVGHNVQFDRKMVIAELRRLSKQNKITQIEKMMNDSNFVCTMERTQPICNLKSSLSYVDKKTGEKKVFQKIKPPKLMEAYKHYFGYEPSGEALHDAIVDVVVCLRVYCMSLDEGYDICGTNPIIDDYIMRISPPGYRCGRATISIKAPSSRKKTGNKKTTVKRKLTTVVEEPEVGSKSASKPSRQKSPKVPTLNNDFSGVKIRLTRSKTLKSQIPKSQSPKSQSPKSQSPKLKSPKLKSPKSQSPKLKSPKLKTKITKTSRNVASKKITAKSKSKRRKTEMSDFIVDDDY